MRWVNGSCSVIGANVSRPTTSSTVAQSDAPRPRSAVEHAVGEVQPGGRRRRRRRLVGEDGLVALGIVERRVDVRRQRQSRRTAASDVERVVVTEQRHDERVAGRRAGSDLDDRSARRVVRARVPGGSLRAGRTSASHDRRSASRGSSSSTSLAPPVARRRRSRAGITRVSLTTSRSPGSQQFGEIADVTMFRRRVAPVDEQPSGVTWFDRHLGDQRRVEVVVEVLEAHDRQATVAARPCSRSRRAPQALDPAIPRGARPPQPVDDPSERFGRRPVANLTSVSLPRPRDRPPPSAWRCLTMA